MVVERKGEKERERGRERERERGKKRDSEREIDRKGERERQRETKEKDSTVGRSAFSFLVGVRGGRSIPARDAPVPGRRAQDWLV